MLATHFAPVHGNDIGISSALPDFDKASFDLLLEESLGHDDFGEPNLGTDIDTNHKLISVLFKAGIDRAFGNSKNPFNAYDAGRDELQFVSCLDVINLAVQRSPGVLFVLTTPAELSVHEAVPLYVWLMPKLLALLSADQSTRKINQKIQEVLEALLSAESLCSTAGHKCRTISEFYHSCTEAILEDLDVEDISPAVQRAVSLGSDQEAFTKALSKLNVHEIDTGNSTLCTRIPAAFVAALTVIDCQVANLAKSSSLAKTNRVRSTSQLIDQLEHLWHVLLNSLEEFETSSAVSLADFFATLQLLKSTTSEKNLTTCRQRCTFLWATSFSDCMEIIYNLTEDSYRETLKVVLQSTLQAVNSDPIFGQILFEILDSRLLVIKEEGQLENELHVRGAPLISSIY